MLLNNKKTNNDSIVNTRENKNPIDSSINLLKNSTVVEQEIVSPIISLYTSVQDVEQNTHISLYTVLEDIKNGTGAALKASTDKVRSITDKDAYKAAKTKYLQAIVPTCLFKASHSLKIEGNLLQYHSIINIDIDVQDNPELFADTERLNEFLNKLREQKQLIAFWRSVSNGISILYKLSTPIEQHLNAFLNIEQEFAAQGLVIDKACKNANRLRFINYDANIYINPLFTENKYDAILGYTPQKDLTKKAVIKPVAGAGGVAVSSSNEIVNHVLNITKNTGKSYTDGQRAAFIAFVGGMLNQFGVSLEEATKALTEVIPAFDTDRLEDIYERYVDQHATEVFVKQEYKQENIIEYLQGYTPKANPVSYDAQIERYLSEFTLSTEGNFILNVPTGAGKTRYFAEFAQGKRVLLVPSIALAQQIEAQYGIKAVYEGVTVQRTDKQLVATYEALPKLIQILDIVTYDLYIDESHAFAQSSTKAFRNKPLSYIAEFMHFFYRTVLLTGTWIPTQSPLFKDFEYINIKSESKQVGSLEYVIAKNKTEALKQHISSNKDTKHAIYYNSKNKAQELATALQSVGLGTYLVLTSVTKNKPEQAEFIRTGILSDAYAGVIFTDVIREGLGIENTGVSFDVHVFTKADSVTTEQVINRVRKVVPKAYYYATEGAKINTKYYTEADRISFEQKLRAEARERVKDLEHLRAFMLRKDLCTQYSKFNKADEKVSTQFTDQYRELLVVVSSDIMQKNRVDELGVVNGAYRWYSDAERANPKMLLDNLATYGYKIEVRINIEATENSLAESLREAQAATKDAKQVEMQHILETFAEQPESYVAEVHESKLSTPIEKDLAFKYLYLHKRLANTSDVLELLARAGTRTEVWNRLKTVLDNQITVNTTLEYKRSTNALIRQFAKAFELGRAYTSTQIFEIVKQVMSKHKKTTTSVKNLTPVKAVQLVKQWFTVTEDRNNGRTYKLERLGAFEYELKTEFTQKYQPEKDTLLINNIEHYHKQSVLQTVGQIAVNQCVSSVFEAKKCDAYAPALESKKVAEFIPTNEVEKLIMSIDFSE